MSTETLELTNFRLKQIKLVMVQEPVHPDLEPVTSLTNPYALRAFLKPLQASPVEQLIVILLNHRLDPVGVNVVSQGTVNASFAHPREIFKAAVLANASYIILAHNHPAGSSKPSKEDIETTKLVAQVGKLMQIPLLDHVIITSHGSMTSLKEENHELFE